MAKYKSGVLQEEKIPKEATIKEISEAFIIQFEKNFIEHYNAIRNIPETSIPKGLKNILNQLENDTYHFIYNYWMTQNIINVDENGKPLIKGGQGFIDEYFFVLQTYKKYFEEHQKKLPYKILLKEIEEENIRRKQNGEPKLREIHQNTYTNYKKQIESN